MIEVANDKSKQTVSVSVDTVIVIVFAGRVIELRTAGAVTLVDNVREWLIR